MINNHVFYINGGFTTPYFNLEKGSHQGDPISAYMFILALEVLFNVDIIGITIFNHTFLYTAFVDDSNFFLSDLLSVNNLTALLRFFLFFRG